jgi:hypothetical protein
MKLVKQTVFGAPLNDPQPAPKAPAQTWQEQVANIQRNLAAKTMSCDCDTHRNDNPQWIEEEKP